MKVIVMRITPNEAARIIGKSGQFIRIGLQRNLLKVRGEPIGLAVKMAPSSQRYTYYIRPDLLAEYAGISLDEMKGEIESWRAEK